MTQFLAYGQRQSACVGDDFVHLLSRSSGRLMRPRYKLRALTPDLELFKFFQHKVPPNAS